MGCIFLTGFMGTGKTSIGTCLAARLGCSFYDLDALIVATAGQSINSIFSSRGETWFRHLETEVLRRFETEETCVVATGGGAVLAPENRGIMRSCGTIVNLTAPAAEIQRRLRHEGERPLLRDDKSLEKIQAMLDEREPAYADADLRVSTTGKAVPDLVEEIYLIVKGSNQ